MGETRGGSQGSLGLECRPWGGLKDAEAERGKILLGEGKAQYLFHCEPGRLQPLTGWVVAS